MSGHVGVPAALAFSPDGARLLSGGRDQMVNVWSLEDCTLLSSIAVLEAVEAVMVLPSAAKKGGKAGGKAGGDGVGAKPPLEFITAGDGGLLRCWDAGSGRCTRRQPPPSADRSAATPPPLTALVRCGAELLAVSADHNFVFHGTEALEPRRCIVGYNDEITDLKYVPLPPAADAAGEAGEGGRQVTVATNSEQIHPATLLPCYPANRPATLLPCCPSRWPSRRTRSRSGSLRCARWAAGCCTATRTWCSLST